MENSVIVFLYLLCFSLIRVAKFQAVLSCAGANEGDKFEINDGTCQNYYMCVNNGFILVPERLSCAPSIVFDPTVRECTPGAICLQAPVQSRPCYRSGPHWIPDANCKLYYLCYWNGTQYVATQAFLCPNSLVFNRFSETCVPPDRYLCRGING